MSKEHKIIDVWMQHPNLDFINHEMFASNGKKKVLFGSNYPIITPAKCLEDLDGLELSQEVRELFLYQTSLHTAI